ncbi:Hypothetical protein AA314_00825 [Archangium gephyra]|uniref:Uncharacterized protein n=1 Tax=Archangium gephyra TaxID=48 RepID=A0AAC8Q2P9_9BACT|nr:Hypothetical protein AA314_00825 [Archangium gephyra]
MSRATPVSVSLDPGSVPRGLCRWRATRPLPGTPEVTGRTDGPLTVSRCFIPRREPLQGERPPG